MILWIGCGVITVSAVVNPDNAINMRQQTHVSALAEAPVFGTEPGNEFRIEVPADGLEFHSSPSTTTDWKSESRIARPSPKSFASLGANGSDTGNAAEQVFVTSAKRGKRAGRDGAILAHDTAENQSLASVVAAATLKRQNAAPAPSPDPDDDDAAAATTTAAPVTTTAAPTGTAPVTTPVPGSDVVGATNDAVAKQAVAEADALQRVLEKKEKEEKQARETTWWWWFGGGVFGAFLCGLICGGSAASGGGSSQPTSRAVRASRDEGTRTPRGGRDEDEAPRDRDRDKKEDKGGDDDDRDRDRDKKSRKGEDDDAKSKKDKDGDRDRDRDKKDKKGDDDDAGLSRQKSKKDDKDGDRD